MKKLILLAAVALLSLGASAQKYNVSNMETPKISFENSGNVTVGKLEKKVSAPAKTRAGETPAGKQREFFLMRYETVGVATDNLNGLPFVKFSKEKLIFSDDNTTVYIPNMLYTSQFESTSYLVGTLNSAGTQITVQSGQVVGNIEGRDLYVSVVGTDGGPSTTPFIFNIDTEQGVIYNPSTYLGLFIDATTTQTLRYVLDLQFTYYPIENTSFFPEASLTRPATCVELSENGMENLEYTVEDINTNIGIRLIKGLFPAYPNTWTPMYKDNSGFIIQPHILNDEILIFQSDTYDGLTGADVFESLGTPNVSIFSYNSATDVYSQPSNDYLMDVYFPDQSSLKNSVIYSNIVLGTGTPTGINNVETSTDKEAVSVEYYDLSGRRISAAEKGVSIKVEKYADGTSKAVKVMK